MEIVDPSSVIRGLLLPGEDLLWIGRPIQGFRLRPPDVVWIPLSLVNVALAGFFIWIACDVLLTGPWPAAIPVFAAGAFMAFGAYYAIAGRFLADLRHRRRTYYGITSQRVVLAVQGPGPEIKSLPLRAIGEATLRVSTNGRGTIRFGSGPNAAAEMLMESGWPVAYGAPPRLDRIDEASRVYDLLLTAQHAAFAAPAPGGHS